MQDVKVIEVVEMLVATVSMFVFVPIVSSSTELEYATKEAMALVKDAQSSRVTASLLFIFSASFIFELTFVIMSFDWYRTSKTFFKELVLVVQVAM